MARALTETGAGWTDPLAKQLADKAIDAGETSLVLSAIELAPGMVSGMVLAAVLAAICSTADSQLVVAASSVANDLYSRITEKTGRASPREVRGPSNEASIVTSRRLARWTISCRRSRAAA